MTADEGKGRDGRLATYRRSVFGGGELTMEELLCFFLEAGLWSAAAADALAPPYPSTTAPIYTAEQLWAMSNDLLQANPRAVQGYFVRGVVLHSAGRSAEAAGDLQEAIRLQPDHAPAWQLLAEARTSCGDYDGARLAQQEADRLTPRR